jgi:hypothetical protein
MAIAGLRFFLVSGAIPGLPRKSGAADAKNDARRSGLF